MRGKTRIFKTKDGIYHPDHQLATAYYLVSGKKAAEDADGYEKWIESIMGIAIIEEIATSDMVITKEMFKEQKALAVQIYAENHGLGFSEASRELAASFGMKGGKK